MIDQNVMKAAAVRRKEVYAVLSAYYLAPPTAEMANIVASEAFVAGTHGSLGAAAREFAAAVREAAAGNPVTGSLQAEHTSLFVLPSGVVPHESYYLDENKRMGGRVTAGVQQCYENACASMTEDCLELADHVGVELEFMTFLCDLEEQFWNSSDVTGVQTCVDLQRSFLEDHLLRWHRPLCEKILAEASLDLFQALARLTIEFLESERAHVSNLCEQVCTEGRKLCECAS